MRTFLRDDGGQAIVEYMLALALVVSVITILATGFRKSLFKLWEFYAKGVAAPCPGCSAPSNIRFK